MAMSLTAPFTVGYMENGQAPEADPEPGVAAVDLFAPVIRVVAGPPLPGCCMRTSVPSSMYAPRPGLGRCVLISCGSAGSRRCSS